jgi:four helix bundle protein
VAWQLCTRHKEWVFPVVDRPKAKRDYSWCDQIRKSARSAPSLIEEGFGRFRPKDNARYVEMAKASVYETRGHLRDGGERGYLTPAEFRDLYSLTRRALKVCGRYQAYLRSPRAELEAARARANGEAEVQTQVGRRRGGATSTM